MDLGRDHMLRSPSMPLVNRDALSNFVVESASSGMGHCFMKPRQLAKPGFFVEHSASLRLPGVQRVMRSVVHQIIDRTNGPQALSMCG